MMGIISPQIGLDKIEHFIIFIIASFIAALVASLLRPYSNVWSRILMTNATLSLVGIIEEYRQWFSPSHTTEFLDAIADLLGIMVGSSPLILVYLIWRAFHLEATSDLKTAPILLSSITVTGLLLSGLVYLNQSPALRHEQSDRSQQEAHQKNSQLGSNKKLSKMDIIYNTVLRNDKKLGEDAKKQQDTNGTRTSLTNQQHIGDGSLPASKKTSSVAPETPTTTSVNLIIQKHKPDFEALQEETKSKLEAIYQNALKDYNSKKDSANKLELVLLFYKYKNQADALEKQTDAEFQKRYQRLQKDLSDHGYDPKKALPVKQQYEKEKADIKSTMLKDVLGNLL